MRSVLAIVAACLSVATPAAAEEPSLEAAFGRIPSLIDTTISPDGNHVALLGGTATGRVMSIATVDRPELPSLQLGDLDAFDLRWVGNEYVLAHISAWKDLGPKAYEFERYISVNVRAEKPVMLLGSNRDSRYLISQNLIGVTKSPPRAVMVGLRFTDRTEVNLLSVDPATGEGHITDTAQPGAFSYGADAAGVLRMQAYLEGRDRRYSVLYRAAAGAPWKRVWGSDWGSDRLIGYAAGDNALYVVENERVTRLNLDSGAKEALGPSLAHASPVLDWDIPEDRPVAIEIGAERTDFVWLDPEMGAVHASLAKTFPGERVELNNWSDNRRRVIIRVAGWDAPEAWYLLDRDRKELSPLGVAYPELKGKPLGVTRWIGFKARDGLEMGAYLTVPPGAASKSRLPVIVLPHDDVEGRDSEDFNYLVHYLAARGYAVLRPQYRGSTIFGAAFKDAGNGEWARKIPTDLLDALTAAGATGQVDPARACIVGFGFGGYEALVGAAFHPGSYRCAASIGGISSLGLLVADYRRRTAGDTAVMDAFRAELGDTDRASLDAASPSRNAAAVSIPVLLVHGNHDAVVPIEQATLMAEALKAAGRPYELVVLDGENHTLHRSDMRIRTLSKLGEFLTKNLPTQP